MAGNLSSSSSLLSDDEEDFQIPKKRRKIMEIIVTPKKAKRIPKRTKTKEIVVPVAKTDQGKEVDMDVTVISSESSGEAEMYRVIAEAKAKKERKLRAAKKKEDDFEYFGVPRSTQKPYFKLEPEEGKKIHILTSILNIHIFVIVVILDHIVPRFGVQRIRRTKPRCAGFNIPLVLLLFSLADPPVAGGGELISGGDKDEDMELPDLPDLDESPPLHTSTPDGSDGEASDSADDASAASQLER